MPRIPINRTLLAGDGWSDLEMDKIERYINEQNDAGKLNSSGALIKSGGQFRLVLTTVAEICDQLHPGCWDRDADVD